MQNETQSLQDASQTKAIISPKNHYIVGFIALGTNIILTILLADFFGIIGSGIVLGLSKHINKKTLFIFYPLSFLFFLGLQVWEGQIEAYSVQRSIFGAWMVVILGALLMPAISVFVMWAIKKLKSLS
jgi:hypothetical protein